MAGVDSMKSLDGQRVGLRRRVGLGGLRREPEALDDDETGGVGQRPLGGETALVGRRRRLSGGTRGAGEYAPVEVDSRRHRAAPTHPQCRAWR